MRTLGAFAALALGVLASSAQGAELFRRGDFVVDFSGSIRSIGLATRGTDLEDFEEAARESLVEPDPLAIAILSDPELRGLLEATAPGLAPSGSIQGRRAGSKTSGRPWTHSAAWMHRRAS